MNLPQPRPTLLLIDDEPANLSDSAPYAATGFPVCSLPKMASRRWSLAQRDSTGPDLAGHHDAANVGLRSLSGLEGGP
uniref:Uncharacterized protein n=1 Tax=Panagrolaimus superbus TaxID=310955 RepID=A0A914YEA4_9BILA